MSGFKIKMKKKSLSQRELDKPDAYDDYNKRIVQQLLNKKAKFNKEKRK